MKVSNGYFVLALIITGIIAVESRVKGKVTCFRKIRKYGKCAGVIRKGVFDSEAECCEKGLGYAVKKVKVGKNRYRCTPCDGALSSVTRTHSKPTGISHKRKDKKSHKDRKVKRKHRNEKERRKHSRPKTTNITPTTTSTSATTTSGLKMPVDTIVDIQHHGYNMPTKFGEISYSYKNHKEEEKVKWGPWSPCSVTCGAGWRSRFKVCDDCDRNDYENVQSQPCMVNFYCPVDGNWGPWFPWQPCSISCDGGFRIRQRKCNYPPPAYGGLVCPGQGGNNQTCNKQLCPVDGAWSAWSEFDLCSVTCGQGLRQKHRSCSAPPPENGGKNCKGTSITTKKCQNSKCPQDGDWSLWGSWASCAVTCGRGLKARTRSCDSPRPMHGGKDCGGNPIENDECFGSRKCAVHGGWSDWTIYGFCTAQRCEKGYQVRSRTCTRPTPRYGGLHCEGDQYERLQCLNIQSCPRNGSWCEWSTWSKCTATCRSETALRVRQKECKCPAPRNGGAECDGDGIAVRTCNELPPCVREKVNTEDNQDSTEGSGDFDDLEGDDYPDHTEMEEP